MEEPQRNDTVKKRLRVMFPEIPRKQISECLKNVQKEILRVRENKNHPYIIPDEYLLAQAIDRLTVQNNQSSSDDSSENSGDENVEPIVKVFDETFGSVLSDGEIDESMRSENHEENHQQEQRGVVDVNAAALRLQLELERNVETIQNVFPDVQREWIETKLREGHNAHVIVDFIVSNPEEAPRIAKVPKEVKATKPVNAKRRRHSSKKDEPTAFYILNNGPVSREYKAIAPVLLFDDFPQVSQRSVNDVLTIFNGHYAPSFQSIQETLETNNKHNDRIEIPLIINEIHTDLIKRVFGGISIKLLKTKRKKATRIDEILKSAPRELIDEVQWSKENLLNKNNKFSASNIFTPRRAARQRAEAEFECLICCDMYLITEMVSCTDGHLFCPECLRNYAKEVVYGQAKVLLTCLNIDCKCGYTRATLESILDDKCIEKLDERLQLEEINSAGIENLIRCKFCNFAAIVDVPVEQNKVFKCENSDCEKEFCRICNVDWAEHVGLPCKDVETSDEIKLRKEMEEKMVDAIARECHQCKSKIIKETGCNKMTCRCGAKLCYVCRSPGIDYDHFCRHVRSPGKKCALCKACSLWEDTTKTVDVTNLEKVKQEAHQGQQALGRNLDKVIGVDETKFPPPVAVVPQPNVPLVVQQQILIPPAPIQQGYHVFRPFVPPMFVPQRNIAPPAVQQFRGWNDDQDLPAAQQVHGQPVHYAQNNYRNEPQHYYDYYQQNRGRGQHPQPFHHHYGHPVQQQNHDEGVGRANWFPPRAGHYQVRYRGHNH